MKIQNVQFEEKRNTRKFNIGDLIYAESDKENEGRVVKGMVSSGTPHTAIPATCKKKRSKEVFGPKQQQQVKAYTNVI